MEQKKLHSRGWYCPEHSNPSRRKRDIGNLEKAPTDLLVEHKVIESDDNTIVRAIALGWSKSVTGARVQIIPVSKA